MHYHLRDHIYVTQFRNELVLLDTKKDKYMICFQEISDLLINLLNGKKTSLKATSFSESQESSVQEVSTLIQNLLDDHVIEEKNTLFPFHIDLKSDSKGVSNVDWSLPLERKKVRFSFDVLNALITLIKVNLYIKMRGLYSTIRLIKKSRKNKTNYIVPPMEDLTSLANIVNKACLLYPTRTKCLEWAMTYVLIALQKGWKCNLEIGVQNYPFMAHAWVECDGKIVMDSQNLRKGLGIILNEPFRKLKT